MRDTLSHRPAISESSSIVYVIDDDLAIREAIESLFRSVGIHARTYSNATDFLAGDLPDTPSCLLLDVRLKGPSGFVVQNLMRERQIQIPIIFMTAHGDVAMSVKAMKAGAFDFLTKPVRDQELLDIVADAFEVDERRLRCKRSMTALKRQYESLTPRQREVMAFVVSGLMNKQIASEMRLSEITVKIYRREAMKKMGAMTVADLVRKAVQLGVQLSLIDELTDPNTLATGAATSRTNSENTGVNDAGASATARVARHNSSNAR
ncbi:response regulator transcription factor [Paraburkholderia rhizosphaerae]|uniref:LuxR family two component transcriptional regulator n=1 Tax=Paraburkholderia rhizosphaerae TaxID=480658 RepID=A0A4V3HF49_9BURK|nr:response regulator [Paraburkholderia rhizosphaerae]TDY51451.1 LuxR family two component transcriptional regulator [Paraburkholderia rhizosphaerae]